MNQNKVSQSSSDAEKDCVEFLRLDFGECFQERRHINEQILSLSKFAFLGYSSVTAAAFGLYQFGIEKNIDLQGVASIIIGIGLIVGLFLFWLSVRNRFYFVKVTRYINEVRNFFFEHKPTDFENKSEMYTDWQQPSFYNWRSSQIWFCYLVAFLNASLLAVLLYMYVGYTLCWNVFIIVSCFTLLLFIQVMIGILYLKTCDKRFVEKEVREKE